MNNNGFEWDFHGPLLLSNAVDTLYMVGVSLLIGGLLGLLLGIGLYTTRRGGLLANRAVYTLLNFLVNLVRPVPFLILLFALVPVTLAVVGTTIGPTGAIVPLSVAATFGFSRIVEQNLVSIDPGIIEAARATGASRWRIVGTLLVPEALGPLILGYTFLVVALIDMSVMAGAIGGRGLGDFALQYGYRRYNFPVMWITIALIVVIVQVAQAVGNRLSRYVLRR